MSNHLILNRGFYWCEIFRASPRCSFKTKLMGDSPNMVISSPQLRPVGINSGLKPIWRSLWTVKANKHLSSVPKVTFKTWRLCEQTILVHKKCLWPSTSNRWLHQNQIAIIARKPYVFFAGRFTFYTIYETAKSLSA